MRWQAKYTMGPEEKARLAAQFAALTEQFEVKVVKVHDVDAGTLAESYLVTPRRYAAPSAPPRKRRAAAAAARVPARRAKVRRAAR